MKRIWTSLLAAGLLTTLSGTASAGPISVNVGNFTGGTATLHAAGTLADGLTVITGAVLITGDLGTFESYCVDLQHYDTAGLNGATLDSMDHWNNGVTSAIDKVSGGEASWLYNKYAASAVGNQVMEAALSLAIWNALYDSDYNVLSGTFWASSVSLAGVTTMANNMLSDLKGVAVSSLPYDTWIRTNNNATNYSQDFIAPVPEPAMLILLGTSMAGAFGFRRRLTRKRSAAS
jgi:hypothetical protein